MEIPMLARNLSLGRLVSSSSLKVAATWGTPYQCFLTVEALFKRYLALFWPKRHAMFLGLAIYCVQFWVDFRPDLLSKNSRVLPRSRNDQKILASPIKIVTLTLSVFLLGEGNKWARKIFPSFWWHLLWMPWKIQRCTICWDVSVADMCFSK